MILLIFISATFIYGIRSLIFHIGAAIERRRSFAEKVIDEYPFVSVIVPARNEEENITACIDSLAANFYPRDKFEIIAVNDRSEDSTAEIMNKLEERYSNLKIVHVEDESSDKNLQGKPGALQHGIDRAQGDIICMTDADCIVNPNWINRIVKEFNDKDISIVASYTEIIGDTFFRNVQEAEWVMMHTMASGGIGLNIPLGCYGNNLSVRRKNLDAIGGYRGITFSVTEDLALLTAIINSGGKARYLISPDSAVITKPMHKFSEYMRQHHRWAVGGMKLGWKAAIFVLSTLALWLGIITSLVTGNYIWSAGLLATRLILDYSLIMASLRILKKPGLNLWIFPAIFFLMIMELTLPFLLLKKNIVWKGRIFRN